MARPRTKYPPDAIAALEVDWRGGTLSLRDLSRKHEIPIGTIRDLMAGIAREGGEVKRALVRAAASGTPNPELDKRVSELTMGEVARDVLVMGVVATGGEDLINKASTMIKDAKSAWELPALASALSQGMTIYRKARELDDPEKAAESQERRIVLVKADGSEVVV